MVVAVVVVGWWLVVGGWCGLVLVLVLVLVVGERKRREAGRREGRSYIARKIAFRFGFLDRLGLIDFEQSVILISQQSE